MQLTELQKNKSKFSAAFTAGALLFPEVTAVMPLLCQEDFASLLDQEAKENNLLRINSQSARTRVVTELKRRVRGVDTFFWQFFKDRSEFEQKLAMLYLVLKAYPLAFDFHFEVVLKKWRSLDYTLERFDLQMRLDELASEDEEVAGWTESTKTKLLTVFLRMLREAGLLGRTRLKKPEGIEHTFWEYFAKAGEGWFLEASFLSKTERDNLL